MSADSETETVPTINRLPGGLTVIAEYMPGVESVAYELCIPGGLIYDAEHQQGGVLALAELLSRGAGDLDAKQLSDSYERLGARHSESAGSENFYLRGLCLGSEFEECLKLTALQVKRPHLSAAQLDPIKSLLLQDIRSLPDDPARHVMHELSSGYLPAPYNRPATGTADGIADCSAETMERLHRKLFSPRNAILSVAGKIKEEDVTELVLRVFEGWQGDELLTPEFGQITCPAVKHVQSASAQIQIALAYPSAKFGDEDYYSAKLGSAILSGGMFGRVFVEVREKRGLVYTVSVRHVSNRYCGYVLAYAGTTPERAQETLEVLCAELRGLSRGISDQELRRAKTFIKSSLVLGDESSSSRASSNAHDFRISGRVRPFQEIMEKLNSVSEESIERLCRNYPADEFFLVTLGNRALEVQR